MVYISGQIFLPFCHNARVWRTDRQTDRRTEFSSLDRVCIGCSAVKTAVLRFWALFWGLTGNVCCSSWSHWKACSGLLISDSQLVNFLSIISVSVMSCLFNACVSTFNNFISTFISFASNTICSCRCFSIACPMPLLNHRNTNEDSISCTSVNDYTIPCLCQHILHVTTSYILRIGYYHPYH